MDTLVVNPPEVVVESELETQNDPRQSLNSILEVDHPKVVMEVIINEKCMA